MQPGKMATSPNHSGCKACQPSTPQPIETNYGPVRPFRRCLGESTFFLDVLTGSRLLGCDCFRTHLKSCGSSTPCRVKAWLSGGRKTEPKEVVANFDQSTPVYSCKFPEKWSEPPLDQELFPFRPRSCRSQSRSWLPNKEAGMGGKRPAGKPKPWSRKEETHTHTHT